MPFFFLLMERHCPTFTYQLVPHEHVIEMFLSGMRHSSQEDGWVARTLGSSGLPVVKMQ